MSGRKRSIWAFAQKLWAWFRWSDSPREKSRNQWQRLKIVVAKPVAIFIERWLGFWYALFLTALLGTLTGTLFRAPLWWGSVTGLGDTTPQVELIFAYIGLHLTLAAGLLLFGILSITGFRLLRWTRNIILMVWDWQTPPFEESDKTFTFSIEPASDYSRKVANMRAKDHAAWGLAILFTIITVLLIAEQEAPRQLNNALTDPVLAAIGNTLDTTLMGLDFGRVLAMTTPNWTQAEFVLLFIVFGLPGIMYLFAARNLLYFFETGVRHSLIQIQDDGELWTKKGILIGLSSLYFVAVTISSLSQIFGG